MDESKGNFITKANSVKTKFGGGVIMEVVNIKQALIAETAGASAIVVSSLAIPTKIGQLYDQNVSRMSDVEIVKEIKEKVHIPVFAKVLLHSLL